MDFKLIIEGKLDFDWLILQFLNAFSPIAITDEGIIISVNNEHP